MHGFKAKLSAHEQISLLMLDSATPGRMALTYYQEFLPADYFDNLNVWVDDFAWYQRYTRETQEGKKTAKQTVWPWMPPSPLAIAQTVYGRSLSDTLKKQVYARLLPVIAGGQNVPIPFDWVQQSFQVACSPSGYERWEWERNVGVACALYKGWRARHHDLLQRRTFTMSLETENTSRDYLFGRLFAVLERIESKALQVAGETRSTNAERYLQRFAMRPLRGPPILLFDPPPLNALHPKTVADGRESIRLLFAKTPAVPAPVLWLTVRRRPEKASLDLLRSALFRPLSAGWAASRGDDPGPGGPWGRGPVDSETNRTAYGGPTLRRPLHP